MFLHVENVVQDFSRLLFPHFCVGCGNDLKDRNAVICYRCQLDLPYTNFFAVANNPVEKSFYGRLPIHAAGSSFYFTKDSIIQTLLFELKYKQNISVGFFLGRMMGYELMKSERFSSVNYMIPMPLHPKNNMQEDTIKLQLFVRAFNQFGKNQSLKMELLEQFIQTAKLCKIDYKDGKIWRAYFN